MMWKLSKQTATYTRQQSWHSVRFMEMLIGVITVLVAGGRKQMDAVLATLSGDSDESLSSMSIFGLNMNNCS